MTSWLSDTSANKVVKTYVNGFMDCSGYFLNRVGNVMIGNTDYPGYNVNQRSLLVNGRTQMNGNLTINGNISVNSTNIALGLDAGSITVGTNTVAIGNQAGRSNLGADSVAIGYNTSVSQLGAQSVAVGTMSGYNQQGANNTFLGHKAGYNAGSVMTGGNNIYIGFNTTANSSNYTNSVAIGAGATITAVNQIVLGTTNETVRLNTITPMYTTPSFSAGMIGYTDKVSFSYATYGIVSATLYTRTPVVGMYIVNYDIVWGSPVSIGYYNTDMFIRKNGTILHQDSVGWGGFTTTAYISQSLHGTEFVALSGTDVITITMITTIGVALQLGVCSYVRIA